MGATSRLVFDVTDTESINSSSNVGAFVRSSDGTLIDHQTINAQQWLNTSSAMFDGLGNALQSTNGALNVDIQDTSLNVSVTDVALADASIENTAYACTTTAGPIVTAALTGRKYLAMANEGNKSTYYGKAGVTTSNGFPLHPGQQAFWRIGDAVVVEALSINGTQDVRVMELS